LFFEHFILYVSTKHALRNVDILLNVYVAVASFELAVLSVIMINVQLLLNLWSISGTAVKDPV